MELSRLQQQAENQWRIAPYGKMRVPAIIYASEALIRDMDDKVYEQVTNVAKLPGIVKASYAMPDAHWGYGFPIGGVAAFDPAKGGVISAGGVGFDISCGVRTLHTGLTLDQVEPVKERLADALFRKIPAGVGSTGKLSLNEKEMDAMLTGGAQMGGRHRLRPPGGFAARRRRRLHPGRSTGGSLGPRQEAPARRDGHPRFRQSLSGNPACAKDFRPDNRRGFWLKPGRYCREHSLRLARPRPSDRHGISHPHGGGGGNLWN